MKIVSQSDYANMVPARDSYFKRLWLSFDLLIWIQYVTDGENESVQPTDQMNQNLKVCVYWVSVRRQCI